QNLTDRDRDVSRAGGHINQEHVEISEEDIGEELLHGAVQHWAAPGDDRFTVTEEHADRDRLHSVRNRWQHEVVDARRLGPCRNAEQPWYRETVHIRVDEADGKARGGKGRGEVRGDRGL